MHQGTVQPDGTKVQRLRLERELTQEELATRVGCDPKTIYNVEAGKPCRPVTLGAIAGQLGTVLRDLVLWEQAGTPPQRPAVEIAHLMPGSVPPCPSILIGRDDDLRRMKERLGHAAIGTKTPVLQILTAMHGWPGVGKTSVAAALAHDPELVVHFPDGVLWTSLGQKPDLLVELISWGRAIGSDGVLTAQSAQEASRQLSSILREKRCLLIVDDVWQAEHVQAFRVGGRRCATLITTRNKDVADASAPTPGDVYKLDVLSEDAALELLQNLAPSAVVQYRREALELVRALEGLPLAIQVAGRLLQAEQDLGMAREGGDYSIRTLLNELQDAERLLEASAPADMADIARQTTPTVAALLLKSVDHLDPETRERFALLAPAAPKPATFDLNAMTAAWEVVDPASTARKLVARGLLEPVGESRFQMHALLVALARSLCEE